jgi:FkbM family methyltransferase
LIRRQLNFFAPTGITEVTVAGGYLRGAALKLDLKSEKYYWLGTYEPHLIQAIQDFCREGMVIYDLGANIGYVSLVFAKAVGRSGKVYAFEPLPANIARITEHINLNSFEDIVNLVPCAASDREGSEEFLVHENPAMGKLKGSTGKDYPYVDGVEVRSLRIDDFVYRDRHPKPDLIKIDIEGGGVKAMTGLGQLLSNGRPKVFMELHGPEECMKAWNILKENDYLVHRMEKNYPEVAGLETMTWKDYIVALP